MTYLEPFGGAASVLLNKRKSVREVYNDAHLPTANIFLNLVKESKALTEQIQKIEYKEENFKTALEHNFQYDTVESAVNELVLRRMSRGGMKKHFSWSTRLRGGRPGDLNAWETFKEKQLSLICERIAHIEVYSLCALKVIEGYLDDDQLLLYLDPPYVFRTRTAKKVYDCELTDDQHLRLAQLANLCKGKVIVSGYDCPMYQELYKGWRCLYKEMPNNSGQGKTKQRRLEALWLNY
jgi:DNA adenine methylase